MIEALESRTLLSAGPMVSPFAMTSSSSRVQYAARGAAASAAPDIHGVKLHLVAHVPFTGQLGFYASPVLDPPLGYSASIDWGDGTTSDATLQYGIQGTAAGYQIVGSHTYAKAGRFKIETTLTTGPIAVPGQPPAEFPTRLIETIVGKAIVSAAHENSAGGVTIGEIAGQSFSADIGSFSTIAPATHLHAAISWGDGGTSHGMVNPTGVIGIEILQFSVAGTHTYAQPGAYPIHVKITRLGTGTTTFRLVASIISTATVSTAASPVSLAGTISGAYTTPLTNPDAGLDYDFTGSGNTGALGDVSVTGNVLLPGFIASGNASGSLTLNNSQGSVTLQLTGPMEPGFGAFPSTLTFVITQATGAYAGDTGSGTIAATLTPGASATDANQFGFVVT